MRNPIRRNRNIGKTQGGRVKDGRAVEKVSRAFPLDVWDKLSEEAGKWHVLRENPSGSFFHPCSGEDYIGVLERLPAKLTSPVKAIVLRRTPKREFALAIEAMKVRSCVLMNSFPRSMEMPVRGNASWAVMRHYVQWCRTFEWVDDVGWAFIWSLEEIRRYYLYHLFLHELGHFHQPKTHKVRRREEFAENFALEWARRLGELGPSYDAAAEQFLEEMRVKNPSSPPP
jgi:hypothetical protein